jgi:hypothetical protein
MGLAGHLTVRKPELFENWFASLTFFAPHRHIEHIGHIDLCEFYVPYVSMW